MKLSNIILGAVFLLNNSAFANVHYTFDKNIPNKLVWTSAYMYHHNSQEYCSRDPTLKEIFQIRSELTEDRIKAKLFLDAMDYNPRDNNISKKEIEGFIRENCTRKSLD